MKEKLEKIAKRYQELEKMLSDAEIMSNHQKYAAIAREHGELSKIVSKYNELQKTEKGIEEAQSILKEEDDKELTQLAKEELETLEKEKQSITDQIIELIALGDSDGHKNVIMEIRAGTGGDEASLFAADLFRMYSKFAEKSNWKIDILNSNPTGLGGFKEIIFSIIGKNAYRKLKFEGGGHRVQRIPVTESSGRIHTSACTIAVLPEAEEIEIKIDPSELRIDTFRSSGPGGQSVNMTDSAVRITHLPTGITVSCQDEKSQHKNKAKAMRVLRSRLLERKQNEQQKKRGIQRKKMIGSGDRSERIRTYNFPQNRVTDHRINLTLYELEKILDGEIDEIINELTKHEKKIKLEELKL